MYHTVLPPIFCRSLVKSFEMGDNKKVCIVTGCSSGIGLHTAVQLSKKGDFKVIATVRKTADENRPLRQSDCDIQILDVTDEGSVRNLGKYTEETYGRCDVIVNNAGYGMPGNLERASVSGAQRVFDVNVWGVMRMVQTFAPLMRKGGGGLIVTVSSTSGCAAMPCSEVYAGSKMAVEGLLEGYRYTVEKDNIKVAVVNPGPTVSQFSSRMRREGASTGEPLHPEDEHWMRGLHNRNVEGQGVEECAMAIATVVRDNVGKDVRGGKDKVRFWNPTSEYGWRVVDTVLRHSDGHEGIYAERFAMARQADAEVAAQMRGDPKSSV